MDFKPDHWNKTITQKVFNCMFKRLWYYCSERFEKDYPVYYGNLSRFVNLCVILNISLFFLTELVTKYGYYYTIYSITGLGLINLFIIFPMPFLRKLHYYLMLMGIFLLSMYFFIYSVWYWIETSKT